VVFIIFQRLLRRVMFKKDPLQIIAFQTYGTANHLYLRGRAIEDESINLEQKGLFALFVNSWKRFETDEIKNTALKVTLPDGVILKTTTDNHGYFIIDEKIEGLSALTNEEDWLSVQLSYDDDSIKRHIQNDNRFPGELLVPSKTSDFGVISDIDDTIIHTGVVSTLKWKVLINSIFKNAASRIPLEGAANLEFFLKQHNFPKGPILLRSFKDIFKKKPLGDKPQKQKEILNILETYPHLKFILIGDCGEYDADIYLDIAEKFQSQILAIYLRSVSHKKKMHRISELFKNYKTIPVLLVKTSDQAVKHAKAHGFI